MSIDDMQHNLKVLDYLQEAAESELRIRADAARRLVESKYTWETFNSRVVNGLKALAEEKNIEIW